MIPILYPPNETASSTAFATHGSGPIVDAISCTVTEDLEGRYELDLTMPATSARMAELVDRAIVLVKPNPYDSLQPFRIYKQGRNSGLEITLKAQHISYDLNGFPCWPLTATGAANAVSAINTQQAQLDLGNRFTLHTDSADTAKVFKVEIPTPERSVIGGAQGSIRSVFGGELRFDAFDIYHTTRRGADRGCVLAYRKSILELRQDRSVEELYTHILPYYHDSSKSINGYLLGVIAGADWVNIKPVDLTGEFSEAPANDNAFNAYAQNVWLPAHPQETTPEIGFQIKTVPPGSIGLDGLESLQLGDTVGVRYEALGITASSRVTSYTWDVLRERYVSLQIGDTPPTAAEAISNAGRLSKGTIPSARYGVGSIGPSQIRNAAVDGSKVLNAALALAKMDASFVSDWNDLIVTESLVAGTITVGTGGAIILGSSFLATTFLYVGANNINNATQFIATEITYLNESGTAVTKQVLANPYYFG